MCVLFTRKERCEKFSTYPPNCDHFVKEIRYGTIFFIQLPKAGFPEDEKEVSYTEFNF